MGCGRVGASLARAIEHAGHEVADIDQDESAFRRLGTTFEGRTITGVGFDRDTLREAGIELPPAIPESLVVIAIGAVATIFVLIRLISIPD